MKSNLMIVGNVLEHAFDGVPGRVAFTVITPASSPVSGRIGNAVRQPAAKRLVAIGCTSFVIVRIKVGVGQVKDLQRWAADAAAGVGHLLANEGRFGNGRQGHFPVVVRIVRDGANVANDETANFIGRQNEPGQDENNFVGHGQDDALAHSA